MKLMIDMIISSVGLGYFYYGKNISSFPFLISGSVLMFYSYFTTSATISVVLGILLAILPFFLNKLLK